MTKIGVWIRTINENVSMKIYMFLNSILYSFFIQLVLFIVLITTHAFYKTSLFFLGVDKIHRKNKSYLVN